MKKGKILVNGSVVLDTIFGKTFFGGCGANIAYGLGLLGVKPMLFSLVGKDFYKNFHPHLKKHKTDLRVHTHKKRETAHFHLTKDEKNKELSSWMPNAYADIHKVSLLKKINKNEIKKVSIAIFSPGTAESIYKHMKEFRKLASKSLAIFDPGQMIHAYTKKQLTNCIDLSDIFILNEVEYKQAKKILGKDPRKLFKNKIIIETQGEKGSIIFENNKTTKVPATRPKKILDTTGAGDAYRAGLIFGLHKGESLIKSCMLGAKIASKNIEYIGGQRYKI